MRVALFATLLLTAGLAAGEFELKALQEDNSQPGESSGTYAIVEDGRVVGMMRRYSSAAPLHRGMGRRGGPADGELPPPAARLIALVRARMDFVGALQDQLLASGCPYARQAALARIQAAAAAAAGLEGGAGEDELPLPPARLFGGPEEVAEAAAAHGRPFSSGPMGHGGPHVMLGRPHHSGPHLHDRAGPRTGPHPHELVAFSVANVAARPHAWGGEGVRAVDPRPRPMFTRPLPLREGGGMAMPEPWHLIQRNAMPAPAARPDVNWRLHDEDGGLNWGLLTFLALAAACAAVWGALLGQYCAYCGARAEQAAAAAFMVRTEGALKALLEEEEEDDDPKAALHAKQGLQYASAHVPPAVRNVTVLHYEQLKAGEQ